jgi:glycosyltransferase involved in cell wall biosynthesis
VGRVIDEVNEQNLANMIINMLEDKELNHNFPEKSKFFIDNYFSEEKMCENLLKIYRE